MGCCNSSAANESAHEATVAATEHTSEVTPDLVEISAELFHLRVGPGKPSTVPASHAGICTAEAGDNVEAQLGAELHQEPLPAALIADVMASLSDFWPASSPAPVPATVPIPDASGANAEQDETEMDSARFAFRLSREPRPAREFASDFEIGEELGKGSFSTVRAVTQFGPKAWAGAAKIVTLRTAAQSDPGEQKRGVKPARAQQELALWRQISEHKHILGLRAAYSDNSRILFVMDRCESGLFMYLWQAKSTERTIALVLEQMLLAVDHISSLRILHCDLKPDNFLIGKESVLKMSDFGLARTCPEPPEMLTSVAGTAPYMSPEKLAQKHNLPSDMWSIGVIAYVLLLGEFPYSHSGDMNKGCPSTRIKNSILSGTPTPSYNPCHGCPQVSPGAIAFVRRLLTRDPLERPRAKDALGDVFLRVPDMPSVESHTSSDPEAPDLPMLRPTLRQAARIGAFEQCGPTSKKVTRGLGSNDISTSTHSTITDAVTDFYSSPHASKDFHASRGQSLGSSLGSNSLASVASR